jgi:acylphosphatase
MRARRIVISGRVQGVGYRDWMCRQAQAMGLSGWVRNRSDGSVEALVDGDTAAVEELLRACRSGPRLAVVTEIREDFADPPEEPGFLWLPTI